MFHSFKPFLLVLALAAMGGLGTAGSALAGTITFHFDHTRLASSCAAAGGQYGKLADGTFTCGRDNCDGHASCTISCTGDTCIANTPGPLAENASIRAILKGTRPRPAPDMPPGFWGANQEQSFSILPRGVTSPGP